MSGNRRQGATIKKKNILIVFAFLFLAALSGCSFRGDKAARAGKVNEIMLSIYRDISGIKNQYQELSDFNEECLQYSDKGHGYDGIPIVSIYYNFGKLTIRHETTSLEHQVGDPLCYSADFRIQGFNEYIWVSTGWQETNPQLADAILAITKKAVSNKNKKITNGN